MKTILTSSVTVLTVALLMGSIWMAVWAWRTFRVSIFAWLVVGRIVDAATSLLTFTPDRAKLESAIKTLQSRSSLSPSEFFVSTTYLTTLFPILATLGFLLIAIGEISHFGPRITPSYQPHWLLVLTYRLRHFFGIFAVASTLVPCITLCIWFRSTP